MFGDSNIPGSIGPNRRGLWVGVAAGCLLLATGAVLVSSTVDGLNFFGARLPDSTPHFPDPPRDDELRKPQGADRHAPLISARSTTPTAAVARVHPKQPPAPVATPVDSKPAPTPVPTPVEPTPTAVVSPIPIAAMTRVIPRPAPVSLPEAPACTRPGYAALLEPATDPIGTAVARSLKTSDLQARIINASDPEFGRQNIDRIMAGDGSSVQGRFDEGTLLVAQLKVHARRTVIDYAPMAEVGGTMELAIVRNTCGTITVQRHHDVPGRSVNATINDGMRGLGEIFTEKISDLVKRKPLW